MGAANGCCVKRQDEDQPFLTKASRCESWHSIPDAEEQWAFFEELMSEKGDNEQAPEAASGSDVSRKRATWYRLRANSRPLALVPEEALADSRAGKPPPPTTTLNKEDEQYQPMVSDLVRTVQEAWTDKRSMPGALDSDLERLLAEGFPELEEWTTQEVCLRMLRAVQGDQETAASMLIKAIECRVRDRQLYATMVCEVTCDIRVIGRDKCDRPTVYMCARSQKRPLKEMTPQIILAFEAAVKLSQGHGNGQVALIADMHKFSTALNMDPYGLKDLAGSFGTVFADRFNSILIVDFSFLAQSIWSMMKPLISERTSKKINFVAMKEARDICQATFTGPTCERILSAFDINRDRGTTEEEREDHARRTAICDVPLGVVRPTDVAG